MTISKRTSLGISLAAIILYWVYQIISQDPNAALPAHFSDFVWRIVRNKSIMLVALFSLLWLEGEGFKELGLRSQNWPRHLVAGLVFGLTNVHRVECRAQFGHELVAASTGAERTIGLRLFQRAAESPGVAADRSLRRWRGRGTSTNLHHYPIREMAGAFRSYSWNSVEFDHVRIWTSLSGARDRHLDDVVRGGLCVCLFAPALCSRANHCARLQRCARDSRRNVASEMTLHRGTGACL